MTKIPIKNKENFYAKVCTKNMADFLIFRYCTGLKLSLTLQPKAKEKNVTNVNINVL